MMKLDVRQKSQTESQWMHRPSLYAASNTRREWKMKGGKQIALNTRYLHKREDMFAYWQQWTNSRCRGPDILPKISRCTRRFGKNKKRRHPGSTEEPQQQTSHRPKRQFPAFEHHGITFVSFSLIPLMFFSLPYIHDTRATYVGGLRCAGFPSLCLSPRTHSLSRWGVSTTFPSYFISSMFPIVKPTRGINRKKASWM